MKQVFWATGSGKSTAPWIMVNSTRSIFSAPFREKYQSLNNVNKLCFCSEPYTCVGVWVHEWDQRTHPGWPWPRSSRCWRWSGWSWNSSSSASASPALRSGRSLLLAEIILQKWPKPTAWRPAARTETPDTTHKTQTYTRLEASFRRQYYDLQGYY